MEPVAVNENPAVDDKEHSALVERHEHNAVALFPRRLAARSAVLHVSNDGDLIMLSGRR
jgi:hypothetical protein